MKLPEQRLEKNVDVQHYLYFLLLELSIKYPDKKMVILLDSIDQLSTSDYNVEW